MLTHTLLGPLFPPGYIASHQHSTVATIRAGSNARESRGVVDSTNGKTSLKQAPRETEIEEKGGKVRRGIAKRVMRVGVEKLPWLSSRQEGMLSRHAQKETI
jgi:hypothetical protein